MKIARLSGLAECHRTENPLQPLTARLELHNGAGFKKPQLPAELTLQQLLHFQIFRQIKHRNACGSQSWGKGEATGSVCSKVQKLLKKLEAGLPAAGRELHWHCLAGGLARGPFLASVVHPELDGSGVLVSCFLRAADSGCIQTAIAGQVSVWRGERWGSRRSLLLHSMSQGTWLGPDAAGHPKCWYLCCPGTKSSRKHVPLWGWVHAGGGALSPGESECHWAACHRWQESDDLLGKPSYKKHTWGSCLLSHTLQILHSYKYSIKLQDKKRKGGNSPTHCLAHRLNKPTAPSAGSVGQTARRGSSWVMVDHLHQG